MSTGQSDNHSTFYFLPFPMSEPELPAPSEPELHEAGHDHDHEHEHTHEEGGASGILKTTTGCGDKCAKCLVCTRKTKTGE